MTASEESSSRSDFANLVENRERCRSSSTRAEDAERHDPHLYVEVTATATQGIVTISRVGR